MAFSLRSSRASMVLCVLAVSVLAACSSGGGSPELTATPSVTANGEHYAYAAGSVAQSDWPSPCSLVPVDSVAAAIGTDVSSSRFHERCYFIPGNDSFPTLTVTILGIGNDQRDAFDRVRDAHSNRAPKSVDGVGQAAISYTLAASPTVNLDVLTDQGLFELSLRSPVGNTATPATGANILGSVGKVLAEEFAS